MFSLVMLLLMCITVKLANSASPSNSARPNPHNKLVLRMIKCVFQKRIIDRYLFLDTQARYFWLEYKSIKENVKEGFIKVNFK